MNYILTSYNRPVELNWPDFSPHVRHSIRKAERKETSLTDITIPFAVHIPRMILSRCLLDWKSVRLISRLPPCAFTDSRNFPLWPRKYFHRHCLRAHGCLPVFLTALFAFPEPVYQDIICKWPVPAPLSLSLSLAQVVNGESIFVEPGF